MKRPPPKKALKFLRWFCREDYIEEIEGNLIELYELDTEHSVKKAKRSFYWNVLLHFRPAYIRSIHSAIPFIPFVMIQHYWKITWRNLLKERLYSFINIGGLAVGLSCFLLIFLYIQKELSFDRFYEDSDQVYRIIQRLEGSDFLGTEYSARTPAGLASAIEDRFPEITHATTFEYMYPEFMNTWIILKDQLIQAEGFMADDQFFNVFSLPFIYGNSQTALNQAENIVLTESLAQKLFGITNPVGKTLSFGNEEQFQVSGVIEDLPENSSFQFSFIRSIENYGDYNRDRNFHERWYSNSSYTYFKTLEGTDPKELERKVQDFYAEVSSQSDFQLQFTTQYLVQAFTDQYLDTRASTYEDVGLKGNPAYVHLFSIIAVLVLLLACVNYMNLAIARSLKRSLEVGLRKVVGAAKSQLRVQFIVESVFIAFLALVLSLLITHFIAPLFGNILGSSIELNMLDQLYLFPILASLVFIVGILSGAYPAFIIASLSPIQAFKKKTQGAFSGLMVQRILIVGQYITSIALIICVIVMYQQFQFIQSKELGYDKDHVLTIPISDNQIHDNLEFLKNQWAANPNILSATASQNLPTNVDAGMAVNYDYEKGGTQDGSVEVYSVRVDQDYLDVFNIALVAGQNYDANLDLYRGKSFLINETLSNALGWEPEEAIGKSFTRANEEITVLGVVKDFHIHSLHLPIEPLMLTPDRQYGGYLSVKVRSNDLPNTISFITNSLEAHTPYPITYQFLDDKFDQLYKRDRRLGDIFSFFAILSILIASMGLFGLAAYSAEKRTKEIGIRKILGAKVEQIIVLLSKDFLALVIVGFVLAIPVAWYAMSEWLTGFAYRVNIQWWMFGLAGILGLVISFLTIISQSVKVAFTNPSESLRDE